MARRIITFLSDFGLDDWFVGVVHGVLHERAPETHVVDLAHSVPPGDLARGAFMLEAAAADFPAGTVHLAVVDPGVGSARRALAMSARGQHFVGPDNGLLEWALASTDARVHAVTEAQWFRQPVSRTFHGRDVFAPVAAAIANGEPLESFGTRILDPVRLSGPLPHVRAGVLSGRVVFIDRFGNALTDITVATLEAAWGPGAGERDFVVHAVGRDIEGLARSYADAPVGTVVAILGSSGRVEIAQVGGAASERVGLGVGDPVTVRLRD